MIGTQRIFAAAALLLLHFPSTGFGEYGFVWANNPTASAYTPDLSYQHNSTGAINTITRIRRGVYQVLMPNLQPKPYGNVQVTAYGYSSVFCNLGAWKKTGAADLAFDVFCFDTLANPVDSRFTALYHDTADGGSGSGLAYTFADQPDNLEYYGKASYSYNSEWPDRSTGVRISRVPLFSFYLYHLDFFGWDALRLSPSGLWETAYGNLQVTTVDARPNRCFFSGLWTDSTFDPEAGLGAAVRCWTPTGAEVPTRFALAYSRDRVPGTPRTIGAYVNILLVGHRHLPGPFPASDVSSFNSISPFANAVVTYLGEGRYRVDIPRIARAYGKSTVLVTASPESSILGEPWDFNVCSVGEWSPVGDTVRVSVQCHSYAGLPRGAAFHLMFITDASY